MPVKIMCAGCPKDEREPAEAAVKAALGSVPGNWTVSLVKIGRQWSLSVDGPDVKHKTTVVPEGGIKQGIQALLAAAGAGAGVPKAPSPAPAPPRAPAPPTSVPVSRPAAPAPAPTSSPAPVPPARGAVSSAPRPAAPPATPRAPLPPSRTAPAPAAASRSATATPTPPTSRAPITPTRAPGYPTTSGERHDRYTCQSCGGAFVVIYEATATSAQETVAVACPHCWKNSHVMVAEEAALSRDYRAEKA
jgi:hypothetical protein